MRLSTCLVALPFLAFAANISAAEDCSVLQAEVRSLREKVRVLEATQTGSATVLSTPAALPGTAAKPAATQTVVIEEPYSKTGCSRGLFQRPPAAKWQDPDLWLDLEKGQLPAAVEALLGVEHYDEQGGGSIVWLYGKCGASSKAQVLFVGGKLADWRAPTR